MTTAALAVGATVTTACATAQATPLRSAQPATAIAATPVADSGSSDLTGAITGSAALPFFLAGVLGCVIGLSTGSTKVMPGSDAPCLPI